jgi:hypothetical protein
MSIIHSVAFFPQSTGGGGGGVQLFDGSYSRLSAGSASCGLAFYSDGTLQNTKSPGGTVSLENWFTPTTGSIGADYEVKCTLTSGTFSTGTSGVWQSLSSTRNFAVSVTAPDYKQAIFNCDIRRVSDSVLMASATFTIEAEAE